jgi:hypothetical protein
MHSDAFDRYHHGHSLIHRLDPRIKVLVTVAYIVSNALLPDAAWIAFLVAYAFLLAINILSGLGVGFTFRRSFIALPFALVAITVLFSIPGKALASFHFLMWNLTITDAGLLRFVSIVIRSWLSVQMAILLVSRAHHYHSDYFTLISLPLCSHRRSDANDAGKASTVGCRARSPVRRERSVAGGNCRAYGWPIVFAEL